MIAKLIEALGKVDLEKIILLILGWLIGLLSPIIVDVIRKRREAKELTVALYSELHELQYRLVNAVGLIEMRYGRPNREFFEWIKSIVKEYRGINSPENLLKIIEDQSSFTDQQLSDVAHLF